MINEQMINECASFIISDRCDKTRSVYEIYNSMADELGIIIANEDEVKWLMDFINDMRSIAPNLAKAFL